MNKYFRYRPHFTEHDALRVFSEAGLKLRLYHMHEGNSGGKVGPKGTLRYVTVATVKDPQTGKVVGEGWAACCPKDNPSRKLGRAIAIGRAYKDLWKRNPVQWFNTESQDEK